MVERLDDDIVYAGVLAGDRMRWLRYEGGNLQPLGSPQSREAESAASAILHDFAALAPDALSLDEADAIAGAFASQFLATSQGVQANFVSGHGIRTWLAVWRMCGLV